MLAFVINFQLWPLPTLSLPWALNVDMMLNREAVTFAASRKGQGSGNSGPDADGHHANARSCLSPSFLLWEKKTLLLCRPLCVEF